MNINWNDTHTIQKLMEIYLLRLIKISSITSDSLGIRNAFLELEKICEELNFCFDYQANGMIMRISNNQTNFKTNCKLAIICHIDTVEYDSSKWSHNPLGEIQNNRIFGRGVIDDKCAIIQSMLAAKTYENYFRKPWIIIVGSCEEDVWIDIEKYQLENHPIPDYATTIDGDGIQFGCRGTANVNFIFKRKSFKDNLLEKIYIPGSANNIIPGLATAFFSDGSQVFKQGKSCHSSIPHNGKNALILLSKSIESNCREQFPGFFNLIRNFKDCTLPEFEELKRNRRINIPSSVCPTTCNIEAEILTVNLNFRISIGTNKDDFLKLLKDMSKKYEAKIEISSLVMPSFMEPNSPMIQAQLDAYKQVIGNETIATIAPGTGYNAAFEAKYGCNIFGPRFAIKDDEEDLCHCNDESRSIEDIVKFYKMLCIFMKNFLS